MGFKKISAAVETEMQKNLPFTSLSFGGIRDGAKVNDLEAPAQLVVEDLQVQFFETNSVSTFKPADVEPYIANVLFGFAMEAQEYALKKAEYEFLTTSTTTIKTYVYTTQTTKAPTEEPKASGTLQFV